jgi:hypothetical protein
MLVHANGETSGTPDAEPLGLLYGLEIALGGGCETRDECGDECECDEITFGTSPCRGCGSTLAGSRHALTYWTTPESLATSYGHDAGKSAASWVFDGNTTDETYRRFLALSDDGDPALSDEFGNGSGWLSGEFADTTLPADLIGMCGIETDDDGDPNEHDWDACMTAYEDAAEAAYWAELERVARFHTED